jgi:hypothetical protein
MKNSILDPQLQICNVPSPSVPWRRSSSACWRPRSVVVARERHLRVGYCCAVVKRNSLRRRPQIGVRACGSTPADARDPRAFLTSRWPRGGAGHHGLISYTTYSSPKHKSCGTSDLEPMRSTNERGPQNIQHACATGPLDTTVSLPGPLYSHLACMHYSTRLEFQINYPVSSMSTHKVIYFSLVFLRNQQGNYCFSMS